MDLFYLSIHFKDKLEISRLGLEIVYSWFQRFLVTLSGACVTPFRVNSSSPVSTCFTSALFTKMLSLCHEIST